MAGREQAACLTAILYDYQEKKNNYFFNTGSSKRIIIIIIKIHQNKVAEYLSSTVF